MKKKLNRLILSVVFIASLFPTASAQEAYVPPAPNNISLIKAFSDNVNLYSGKMNLNIPIYTVKEGSLSVNIGLQYNGGSGIKVQEIAGEAGLGWALLAGSVITRTSANIFETPNTGLLKSTEHQDIVNAISTRGDREELDVFNSTIGGRIIFDVNNIPHFINEQGYKIEENGMNSPGQKWVIVAPNGDKYFFGETLASRERYVYTIGTDPSSKNLTSAWYLNKIVSVKGDVIRFEYEKSTKWVQYSYWGMSRTKYPNENWSNSIKEVKNPSEEIHLAKIISSHASIEFVYTDRADVQDAKAISEIKVLNRNKSLVTKFLFETGYFQSDDPTPVQRLKLNAVKQQNALMDNTRLIAAFEYFEEENLPARNSPMIDHWGYYNNNNTGKYFISEGAMRSADFNKSKANILTSVLWSTGGTTQYVYEMNSFRRNSIDYNGGGVRISSITEVDNYQKSKTIKYDYTTISSGQKVTSGLIHNWFDVTSGYTHQISTKSDFVFKYSDFVFKEDALPMSKIIDLDGINIGYSKVTLTLSDQSIEEYYFQDYASFPDEAKIISYTKFTSGDNRVTSVTAAKDQKNYNGLNAVTSNSAYRGLLRKKIILSNKKEILKSIQYKYDVFTRIQIAGFSKLQIGSYLPENIRNYEAYYIGVPFNERVMAVRLVEAREDNFYLQDKSVPPHSIVSNYEYKSRLYPFLMTRRTQERSDGSLLSTSYRYPSDVMSINTEGDPYVELWANNIISPVVEQIDQVNNIQTSLIKTDYNIFNFSNSRNLVLPKTLQIQNSENPAETSIVFNHYNINGNLLEAKKFNEGASVSLWGYGGQFPVIEVKNATYNQVKDILGESVINSLNNIAVTDDIIKNADLKLRQSLPNALISSYTYDPLIGMTSKRDVRGMKESYKYDDFGRLSSKLDDSDDLVETYTYNVPQLPNNARLVSLAYLRQLNGSGEVLCSSMDRKQYYTINSEKNGRLPIIVGTVLYMLDGSVAPSGYYSRGSGVAYISGGDGKVTNIYNCWDQSHEIEW